MARPDNSVPPRPTSVPAEARWDPKEPGFEWVHGELDAEGRRHGAFRSWTRDGALHGESHYDHGRVHGKNINFHPDGTIASEADWVEGVIMDSVFHRSAAPTTEPFAQAAPNVWSVRYYTRDGKTNYTIRYFARDGSECGPDGQPLPVRPSSVSVDARWFPEIERWVDGEIERGTNTQVGRWRWWSREGVLRHEELRDAHGEALSIAKYRPDGSLEKKTLRDAQGEQRELYGEAGRLTLRTRSDDRHRQLYMAVWHPDGTLAEETTRVFEGDVLVAVTEKGERGARRFEARREGTALACVLYHDDGKVHAATGLLDTPAQAAPPVGDEPAAHPSISVVDPAMHVTPATPPVVRPIAGTLLGTWRMFDEAGALRREVDTTSLAIAHEPTGRGLAARLGEALFRHDDPALATPPQLAGIDAEPWDELVGARDADVEQFPRLVRALVADEPLVRAYALRAIRREAIADRAVFSATARVVPYLARLLSHPALDRSSVLALFQELGEAALPHAGAATTSPSDEEGIATSRTTTPNGGAADGLAALRATARALDASWPQIFAQFASAPLADRRRIFELAKLAPAAKPAILEIARRDADATLRACAARCFIELPTFSNADAAPLLADKDALVRATAAIALGVHRGADAPREAVHGLDDALRSWRDYAKRYGELPFAEAHVLAQIALAAGAIRTADARSLAHQLCTVIDEVDPRSVIAFARGLLVLAFGPAEAAFERPYAKRFVEILETLARSKQFWTNDAAAAELLERWHLPRGRIALLALVAELRGSAEPELAMHAKLATP
ncbi:MAG TPA: hypothetical protein VIV58_35320 [Kofleriaceae bacterium]